MGILGTLGSSSPQFGPVGFRRTTNRDLSLERHLPQLPFSFDMKRVELTFANAILYTIVDFVMLWFEDVDVLGFLPGWKC